MYLWVNLPDLDLLGSIGPLGSPLQLLLNDRDVVLDGGWFGVNKHADEMYIIIEVDDEERADALIGALEVIGKRKIGRRIRTRKTQSLPNPKHCEHIDTPNECQTNTAWQSRRVSDVYHKSKGKTQESKTAYLF